MRLNDVERDSLVRGFRAQGYVVIEGFLPPAACLEMIQAIDAFEPKIAVDRRNLLGKQRFHTLNGQAIEERVTCVREIQAELHEMVNHLGTREYAPIANRQIGVSINVVPPGGEFSFHYDRNEITAVLYLNQVDGGQMELYPRYRRMIVGDRRRGIGKWIQHVPDVLSWPPVIRSLLGHKVVVVPRPGALLVMEAARCLHGVREVTGQRSRYSLQLAYDLPGVAFSAEVTTDYYGYS